MMKKKLWTAAAAVGISAAVFLGGCGKEQPESNENSVENSVEDSGESQNPAEDSGEVQMWDGYYYDDSTERDCYIRLNEDGTYYSSYFDGSVTDAGVWKLLDEELEYSTDGGADGDMNTLEDNAKAMASQVVEMTSYTKGSVKVAYVDDTLTDMSFAGMANHRSAVHIPDYPYDPASDETPIQIYVFYANNDMGCSLILQHDKNFTDVTGDAFLSGSWEMTGEGSYQLSYEDGKKADLTVTDNGKNAVLAYDDGSELALRDDYREADTKLLVMSLRADDVVVEELPMKVGVRLDAYDDGTCRVYLEIAQMGAELVVDEGTWEISETMKPTLHLGSAGDIEGVPDYASAAAGTGLDMALSYAAQVKAELNGAEMEMGIDTELAGTYSPDGLDGAALLVMSLRADDVAIEGQPMAVSVRLDAYDDGTCQVFVEIAQIGAELSVDKGTWEISETMKPTLHLESAGDIEGVPDYASAAAGTGLDMTLSYAAQVKAEFNGAEVEMGIDTELAGTYSPDGFDGNE